MVQSFIAGRATHSLNCDSILLGELARSKVATCQDHSCFKTRRRKSSFIRFKNTERIGIDKGCGSPRASGLCVSFYLPTTYRSDPTAHRIGRSRATQNKHSVKTRIHPWWLSGNTGVPLAPSEQPRRTHYPHGQSS